MIPQILKGHDHNIFLLSLKRKASIVRSNFFFRLIIISYLEIGNNRCVLNLANRLDSEAIRTLLMEIYHGDDVNLHACIILMEENYFLRRMRYFFFTAWLKRFSKWIYLILFNGVLSSSK